MANNSNEMNNLKKFSLNDYFYESWSPKFNLVVLGDFSYFNNLKTPHLKLYLPL